MYADDVKLCLSFIDSSYSEIMQADIDRFFKWRKLNLLSLNCPKCKVITFNRHLHHIINYTLDLVPLTKIDEVNDLGILLDHKLKFDTHVALTVIRATQVLGFIKRWAKEFDDPYTTK